MRALLGLLALARMRELSADKAHSSVRNLEAVAEWGADPYIPFKRNANGSWTALRSVTISGPNGYATIPAGATFGRGARFMGVELAALLDQSSASSPLFLRY